MFDIETKISGQLGMANAVLLIQVERVNKYSLMISFPEGIELLDQTEFTYLKLNIDEEWFEFGRCVLCGEANLDGYAGRLFFLDDVYNFEILINKKVRVNLETIFFNLPLILSHKNKIRQTFKDYVSDLSYDISVYKQYFDIIDGEISDESEETGGRVQDVILNTEGRKFMSFLDTKIVELNCEIKNFSREEHEKHGFYLRKQLWNFIMSSAFMARTNTKPRGYVGDSEMMSMIYNNEFLGTSMFSKLMHKHPVEHPAAQAVRNRRVMIPEILKQVVKKFSDLHSSGFKILSVACGPAVELHDLLLTEHDFNTLNFTLFDQDKSALLEAAKGIELIEKSMNKRAKVTYLKDSVRTMLSTSKISEKWGQYHYIYSMGLFDYLTPPVAAVVLKKLYELLLPGGEMLIGNYHIKNTSRTYMEYWCDWVLYYRDEEEFLNLIDEPSAEKNIFFEDSGSQMFMHVKKNG